MSECTVCKAAVLAGNDNLKHCAICHNFIDRSRFDAHLQECLNSFYDDIERKYGIKNENSRNETVTWLVCNKNVVRADLDNHLEECMVSVFDKDLDLNTEDQQENGKEPTGDTEEDIDEKVSNKSAEHCDNLKRCEICDKFFDSSCFDTHVEGCLNSFYDDIERKYDLKNENSCNETVTCLVCNKNIVKADLDNHLDECMVSVFDKDVDLNTEDQQENGKEPTGDTEEDIDEKVSNKSAEHCDNLKRCEICDKFFDSSCFDTHVEGCLNSFYDDIERKYGLKNENSRNETVTCLVCNKNVVRADLDNHLDECMVSVLDKNVDLNTEEREEDGKVPTVELNESTCDICSICMAPIDYDNIFPAAPFCNCLFDYRNRLWVVRK